LDPSHALATYPIKIRIGKSPFATPELYKIPKNPSGPAISAIGIFAKRPPKPIGKRRSGSKFLTIAK